MAAKRQRNNQITSQAIRRAILLAIIVLLGYVVITQVKSLRPSLTGIAHAKLDYVSIGLGGVVATFLVAALMYQLLAFHRLYYRKTILIQVASGFTNRLLPAGLGGMSLIAQYLRSQKHSTSEAITVVGMDNGIGIIGHFLLFFAILAFANVSPHAIHLSHVSGYVWSVIAVILLVIVVVPRIRIRARNILRQIGHDVGTYRARPGRVLLALCISLLLTILYVGVLWASTRAVGVSLPFSKVLVVFTVGSIIGNATPTPGGLVGIETGLFGGFLAYGLTNDTALAAALLYRLLTYWLPIIPGIAGFWLADRFGLLER